MTTTSTNTVNAAGQSTLDRLNQPSQLKGGGMESLDGADFLRLLTTQLTMQDPLEPTDNQDMLAQMAQFSSLSVNTESGATLEDISAKLDRLIAAQESAARSLANPQA